MELKVKTRKYQGKHTEISKNLFNFSDVAIVYGQGSKIKA